MPPENDRDFEAPGLGRYVPLLIWLIVILIVPAIAMKVMSCGYLPHDDALRHAAKAVSGKSWPGILVLGNAYKIDHNFGWELLLRQIHLWTRWNAESLVVFSVVGLFVLIGWSGLPWLKRPEAWLATLLLLSTVGIFASTAMFGRPYLITMTVLVTILFMWHTRGTAPPGWLTGAWLTVLIALSVFIHGAWYFWALPVAAFFCAREYRWGLVLALAWIAGTLLGAAFTGHPVIYLSQALELAFRVTGMNRLSRTLAGELEPTAGNPFVLVLLGALVVMRQMAKLNMRPITANPAFWLVCLGWVLGFKAERFWDDWGFPALMVLVAFDLQSLFETRLALHSVRRLALTGGLALSAYIAMTSDVGGRWTNNLTTEYLTEDNAELKGWLPGKGGTFYSADMSFFYQTFFKNPQADWRYILGFEPTLMPDDDFKTYNRILWNFGDGRAFKPWVDKMRMEDRLAIRGQSGAPPQISELEWKFAVSGVWIGKLSDTNAPPPPSK